MVDVLEASTGKKLVAIQNGSGHGPGGVYIDYDTTPKTIYIAEAKSSMHGEVAARAPVGSAEARLQQWMVDFEGPRYQNVDAATHKTINDLKAVYGNATVKGLWVQVGVPPVNTSYIVDLDVTINAW